MPQFLYVVASVRADAVADEGPGAVSFRHAFIDADDEDAAWTVGQRALGFQQDAGVTRNDYLVPVPFATAETRGRIHDIQHACLALLGEA